MLLSTHIVSDVEYMANELLLMKDGTIAISGDTAEVISSMAEGVWKCTVPRNQADAFIRRHRVSNVKNLPDGAELRIISANPPTQDAVAEAPSLEDAFLYYLVERGAEQDGSL